MREVRPASAIYTDKVSSCPTLYEGSPKCQRFRHNMTGIAWGKLRGFSWWASGALFVWFPTFEPDSENFQERIMGAGTALGLYNVSPQYQQHNASPANCISSSAEYKDDSKTQNLNDFRLWASFLELSRNHRCALSRKLRGDEKSGVYQ